MPIVIITLELNSYNFPINFLAIALLIIINIIINLIINFNLFPLLLTNLNLANLGQVNPIFLVIKITINSIIIIYSIKD